VDGKTAAMTSGNRLAALIEPAKYRMPALALIAGTRLRPPRSSRADWAAHGLS